MVVKDSGLFTDGNHMFLGASTYGLVGDGAIIEVKCSFGAASKHLSLQQAVLTRKITFWKADLIQPKEKKCKSQSIKKAETKQSHQEERKIRKN